MGQTKPCNGSKTLPDSQMNLALEARDTSIQSAIDHADRKYPEWGPLALGFFRGYASTHAYFQTIAVRAHALAQGLPEPPDTRAWGWVAKEASKRGWVVSDHYAPQPSKVSHARPAVVWRSTVYRPWENDCGQT